MHIAKEIKREEARYMFMKHMVGLVKYWDKQKDQTSTEKLEGLMHSILVTLDGGSGGMPGFKLVPSVHHTDKDYAIKEGFDYFPYEDGYDIGGALHEELFNYIRGEVERPKDLYSFVDSMRDEAIAAHKKMGIFTKEEDYEA
jgi:hypothetical protein